MFAILASPTLGKIMLENMNDYQQWVMGDSGFGYICNKAECDFFLSLNFISLNTIEWIFRIYFYSASFCCDKNKKKLDQNVSLFDFPA